MNCIACFRYFELNDDVRTLSRSKSLQDGIAITIVGPLKDRGLRDWEHVRRRRGLNPSLIHRRTLGEPFLHRAHARLIPLFFLEVVLHELLAELDHFVETR